MRIFYFITKSEAGGAQTQVFQLAKYFSERGDEIAIMSYPGGWLEEKANEIGVKFYPNTFFSNSLNPWRLVLACKEISKAIFDFKPDLINCHSSAAGILVRLLVRNKIPTIFNAVGWSFNVGVPFVYKYIGIISEKIAAFYCDTIICNSKFVKNLGLKYGVGTEDKYKVIYNGVENVDFFKENNINISDVIKIVFVARLAEPKDPIMFLEAYNSLPEKVRLNSEVVIIGDGPKMGEVVNYTNDNNLKKNITLLGNVSRDEVFKKLAESDVFALCTKWESFPYTIIEGMFAGLACIASNVGGISEALDNNHGILVNNTIDEWKNGLIKILQNRVEIKSMGVRGKIRAMNEFSVEKMLIESERVYTDILKKYE